MKGKEKLVTLGITLGTIAIIACGSSIAKTDESKNARESKVRDTRWDIPLPGGEHLETMNPWLSVAK